MSDNPLLSALGWVGSSLDKPGAAVRGLLSGDPSALLNLVPFSDTMGLTDPEKRVSGRGLLEKAGLVGHADPGSGLDAGDVAGFGVDLATDPLNWLGGMGLGKAVAGKAAAAESNALREAMLAKGAMPEEVAALTKVRNEAGPVRTYHGTPHVYDKIDPEKFNQLRLYGPGYYASESPQIANEYAMLQGDKMRDALEHGGRDVAHREQMLAADRQSGASEYLLDRGGRDLARARDDLAALPVPRDNVRMGFIDARRPFDMGAAVSPEDAAAIVGRNVAGPMAGQEAWDAVKAAAGGNTAAAQDALRSAGFDAITHLPSADLLSKFGLGGGRQAERVWIALHANQVYAPWVAPAARTPPGLSPWVAALAGQNAGRSASYL